MVAVAIVVVGIRPRIRPLLADIHQLALQSPHRPHLQSLRQQNLLVQHLVGSLGGVVMAAVLVPTAIKTKTKSVDIKWGWAYNTLNV